MAKKQPALITRYKQATADLVILMAERDELKKKLENSENMKLHHSRAADEGRTTIESVQRILDHVQNSVPRRGDADYSDLDLVTRFGAWLARR